MENPYPKTHRSAFPGTGLIDNPAHEAWQRGYQSVRSQVAQEIFTELESAPSCLSCKYWNWCHRERFDKGCKLLKGIKSKYIPQTEGK